MNEKRKYRPRYFLIIRTHLNAWQGYCFVEFVRHEDAVNAQVSLNGKIALGRKLTVQFAEHGVGGGSKDSM